MSITTTKTVIHIIEIVWGITLLRSIIIMFGKNMFKRSLRNEKQALKPVLNLFSMLDIVEVSTFWGILFFVPFLNLIPLTMMSINLGRVFKVSPGMMIGLVCFPPLFYPLLFLSDKKYKAQDEEYFRALDSARGESINLMTQEEIETVNQTVEETENIDSIFKSKIDLMEEVLPYKAARIDIDELNKIKENSEEDITFKPIEALPPAPVETDFSKATNMFVNDSVEEVQTEVNSRFGVVEEDKPRTNIFIEEAKKEENNNDSVEFIDL